METCPRCVEWLKQAVTFPRPRQETLRKRSELIGTYIEEEVNSLSAPFFLWQMLFSIQSSV